MIILLTVWRLQSPVKSNLRRILLGFTRFGFDVWSWNRRLLYSSDSRARIDLPSCINLFCRISSGEFRIPALSTYQLTNLVRKQCCIVTTCRICKLFIPILLCLSIYPRSPRASRVHQQQLFPLALPQLLHSSFPPFQTLLPPSSESQTTARLMIG